MITQVLFKTFVSGQSSSPLIFKKSFQMFSLKLLPFKFNLMGPYPASVLTEACLLSLALHNVLDIYRPLYLLFSLFWKVNMSSSSNHTSKELGFHTSYSTALLNPLEFCIPFDICYIDMYMTCPVLFLKKNISVKT